MRVLWGDVNTERQERSDSERNGSTRRPQAPPFSFNSVVWDGYISGDLDGSEYLRTDTEYIPPSCASDPFGARDCRSGCSLLKQRGCLRGFGYWDPIFDPLGARLLGQPSFRRLGKMTLSLGTRRGLGSWILLSSPVGGSVIWALFAYSGGGVPASPPLVLGELKFVGGIW